MSNCKTLEKITIKLRDNQVNNNLSIIENIFSFTAGSKLVWRQPDQGVQRFLIELSLMNQLRPFDGKDIQEIVLVLNVQQSPDMAFVCVKVSGRNFPLSKATRALADFLSFHVRE